MITPDQGDISLTNICLTKFAIDLGGRRYITASKLGAMTVKHVNSVNYRILGPICLQITYPLIAYSNAFQ